MTIEGKLWPDLVLAWDTGQPPEFRVQCEIVLNDIDARKLQDLLYGADASKNIDSARRLVLSRIPAGARPEFKQIVERGFDSLKSKPTGKLWPDHIVNWDSGDNPEFRMQCEVTLLHDGDAHIIQSLLYSGDVTDAEANVEAARSLVISQVPKDASPIFSQIVNLAFDSRKEQVRQAKATRSA